MPYRIQENTGDTAWCVADPATHAVGRIAESDNHPVLTTTMPSSEKIGN